MSINRSFIFPISFPFPRNIVILSQPFFEFQPIDFIESPFVVIFSSSPRDMASLDGTACFSLWVFMIAFFLADHSPSTPAHHPRFDLEAGGPWWVVSLIGGCFAYGKTEHHWVLIGWASLVFDFRSFFTLMGCAYTLEPVAALYTLGLSWKKSSIHLPCPWGQVSSQGAITWSSTPPSRPTPSEAKGGSPYEKESKAFNLWNLKAKLF